MSPRVAVVMAVYNGEQHLREAVESILGQTLSDFEFIIVDDASTDGTAVILSTFAAEDARIRLVRNDKNMGLTRSLNRGLAQSRAPIIARMDADDSCHPDRLARQVAFLDANPDHLLVGSGYRSVDGEGRTRYLKLNPLDDFALRWMARFRTPMVHPSFCFRATYPDGQPVRYCETFRVAQDYGIIGDLLRHGKAASIGDPLVDYRMHAENISSTRRDDQNRTAFKIASRIMTAEVSPDEARRFEPLLRTLYADRMPDRMAFASSVRSFRVSIAAESSRRRRRWMRRRAAGILAEAFMQGQRPLTRISWALSYAAAAPDFLPSLAARIAEIKGWSLQDPTPGNGE